MTCTLFTLGYEKRSLAQFIDLLMAAEIDVLVDVRETAWSHKPGFSRTAFADALAEAGIEYVHAAFAGNPKWLRATAETHSECLELYAWYLDEHREVVLTFSALVDGYVKRGKRVCITCFERHAEDCHRSILAERWQALGKGAVTHLATTGAPRLTAR